MTGSVRTITVDQTDPNAPVEFPIYEGERVYSHAQEESWVAYQEPPHHRWRRVHTITLVKP